ncbi:dihydrodipicolinate synthase/N-acetylneuraminate lyase [Sphaerochaeta pleomorpha str. Grapes]|uniref:Dihydrodipicolinate synthase/N-acetylneuraminate lyase n=2 Tax=Sphaerochaeta TaxID=399320 RepID=G8QWU8_SPHPG|nr:dihydrodipicolinate synthase/N-acetylneuraminate lyase [Sphaerochaeta pleomorpha str. Grapes]
MDTSFIKGIVPPIVTPMTKDEKLDEQAFRDQIEWMIEGGITGLLVFGSNGEFYMLEEDEMEAILGIALEQVKGRVPIYMGIGAIRTSKCIRLARMAVQLGVQGISILQPMFLKLTEEELKTHLVAIAESVSQTPVLLYNNPGRTGYAMSQNLVYWMAHNIPNVVGMKDSSGDLTQTEEFVRRNADVGFKVFCGKDTLIYAGLCVGCVGAVTSTSNFAAALVWSIYEKYIAGDLTGSKEAQFALNPLRLQMDSSSFPVATKDYANLVGRKVGQPMLPNLPSPPIQMEKFAQLLNVEGLM